MWLIERGIDSTRIPLQYAGGIGELGAAAVSEFVRGGGRSFASMVQVISRLHALTSRGHVLAGEASGPQVCDFTLQVLFRYGFGGGRGRGSRSAVTLGVLSPSKSISRIAPPSPFRAQPGPWRRIRAALRSGYARYQERLAGKAALVEAPVGSGRVILFGFRPSSGPDARTFKLLFNAVLLAAP